MDFKRCPTCRVEKSYDDFGKNASEKDGLQRKCKDCVRAYHRSRSPESRLNRKLYYVTYHYGITVEQFWRLFEEQEGRCAICRRPLSMTGRGLHVDHNHATGQARALLCSPCNRGIALFFEEPRLLRTAAKYLERWRAAGVTQSQLWSEAQ